ncbi:MAG: YhjD/YihY/BrkB family envelope integrity protein [Gaiellaceae bacterium]
MKLPPPRRTLPRRLTLWAEQAHALRGRIEHARERSATLDATFETIERDSHIGGGMLAGALSYRLFLFVLPLAFFIVSGLGLLASAVGIEPDVISNSVGLAGVVTKQVASTSKGTSSWWVALSSFFVLVYATRVLLRAVAIVHSLAWERSAASVKVRRRSLGIFAATLIGQLMLVAGVGAVNHQTAIGGIITLVAFVFALAGLWLITSLQVPHSNACWTDLIPGSLFYAIGFTGVVIFNILILGNLIQSKTSTYGALGTAATLLLAFFFIGRVIVGAAVLNATLYERRTGPHEPQT